MVGGRRDRGLYGGGNVSGAVMWLWVGETEDNMVDGRNISGARMWLEVGETDDCMVEAMCKESGCGWS